MPLRIAAIALAVAACASAPPPLPGLEPDLDAPGRAVAEQHYTLWWRGARIGTAVDHVHLCDGRMVRLERHERVVVRRGDALSATELRIAIEVDGDLRARSVLLDSRDGRSVHGGRAERTADGHWRIAVDGEPVRAGAGDAVPAELMPYLLHRDGGFAGAVLLAGRGFAIADGEATAIGPGRYRARVHTAAGDLASTVILDGSGQVASIAGGDGVVLRRSSASDASLPFVPPEAIAAGALALDDAAPDDGAIALTLAAVDRGPPPVLPGQSVAVSGDTWRVVLDRSPARRDAGLAAIADLARAVAADIEGDLGAPSMVGADARAGARRGDCTVHALAFAARAAAAGIETRVVTGYRIDGARLVRHRWALARSGPSWIAVDPTFGEAPAAPRLLGLAVHGTSLADLALADAAFEGLAAARVTVAALPRSSR